MDTGLTISIIAAISKNGVIGKGGKIPWHIQADMRRFKQLTMGHPVIMGRKTFASVIEGLGQPLPGRDNIILTRQSNYQSPGAIVVHCLEDALERYTSGEIFIAGGHEIYALALPVAHRMYLTHVLATIDGDTVFPEWDKGEWRIIGKYRCHDNKSNFEVEWVDYERIERPAFVILDHSRIDEQRAVMDAIRRKGVCPFCQEHFRKYHREPILQESTHWMLTRNQWPYDNTRIHLLLIAKEHVETLADLGHGAGEELFQLCAWAAREFGITSGALGMRFGDPHFNRGTVRHLHAQLLCVNVTDEADPRYKPVRFRIG